MEKEIKDVLNRKQRQKNADAIVNALGVEQQDFNVMILGFNDIIQAQFYAFVKAQSTSQTDLNKKQERINVMIDQVLTGFNDSTLDNAEDMIVLATCMIECINRALITQQANGLSIRPILK